MDVKSKEARSKNMAAIKSRDTRVELKLRKALFAAGYRYRVNYKITGKPDIVFVGKKVAVFVDGCFWHACPACYREPENNREFWRKKISGNRERDLKVTRELEEAGWLVLRFWEHEVRKNTEPVMEVIRTALAER
ncbi:very short patch repair endonuclease [Propionispora hippei]|uniref:Very short patch repair endonuclease n=1 Tax=Propionispora hippei DSM 15287 TaxID=1123003 RepID=A0A1M6DZ92_9FIRM|nr:very short patch repair endonuclease [Propionispora hippei]SHI78348.1 T/G mismatch-specific endonuclease [Propionispora hippei DSM 15287]